MILEDNIKANSKEDRPTWCPAELKLYIKT